MTRDGSWGPHERKQENEEADMEGAEATCVQSHGNAYTVVTEEADNGGSCLIPSLRGDLFLPLHYGPPSQSTKDQPTRAGFISNELQNAVEHNDHVLY
jgi:hypothetical protein